MRRPHPSTGAWICIGLIGAAVAAPATVYAAASSTVAIGNTNGTSTARVTGTHQLLTTPIGQADVVNAVGVVLSGCKTVYTPPAGKGIVVTDITWNVGSGTEGQEVFGGLFNSAACGTIVDQFDTTRAFDTLQHTYPTGLPMAAVAVSTSGHDVTIFVHGYLIPAAQLPAAAHGVPQHATLPKSASAPAPKG